MGIKRSYKVRSMSSTEKFCVQWNDFEANISAAFRDLKDEKDFTDVTLACADQQVEAHKVILAACSPFFKKVLSKVQHSHPLIYMKGVNFSDLEAVLSFAYHGEVSVDEANLNSFLALGEELEMKGLASGRNSSERSSDPLLQSNSKHQASLLPLPRSAAQVSQQTPLKTKHEWSAPENRNADGAVPAKRESESSQSENTSQPSVEEVDRYAGYENFKQEKGEKFDFKNHIERISEGVNIGQFKCNLCGYVSSQKSNLPRHMESKHFPGLFEYSCDQCEMNFNTMTKFRNHRRRRHSNMK